MTTAPNQLEEQIAQANANPQVFADKTIGQVSDHCASVIGRLTGNPAVIGHSADGLIAQMAAGCGRGA